MHGLRGRVAMRPPQQGWQELLRSRSPAAQKANRAGRGAAGAVVASRLVRGRQGVHDRPRRADAPCLETSNGSGMSGSPAPPAVGDLLMLTEAEYKFGTGTLRLRVIKVSDRQPEPGWIPITGIEIRWDGSRGDRRQVSINANVVERAKARARGTQ